MRSGSILVIRFSALGDVAMTVPVIRKALQQYPRLRFVVVSRAAFKSLFDGLDRVDFVAADLKGRHKGLPGLFRLYRDITRLHTIQAVADLHAVTRSFVLGAFFRLMQIPVAIIDKGRQTKKALTRKEDKVLQQLASSPERYALVLSYLGYKVNLEATPVKLATSATAPTVAMVEGQILAPSPVSLDPHFKHIGVAPFAQHAPKMYPLEQFEKLLALLHACPQYKLWMFGGGQQETDQFNQWKLTYPGIEIVAGNYTLAEELGLMHRLDAMISMDSANMHLASMTELPVISVWGATHPFAGFYGWMQDPENAVQTNLYCRPCSVYGNKPCYRGDHACMVKISPEMIFNKVEQVLSAGNNINNRG